MAKWIGKKKKKKKKKQFYRVGKINNEIINFSILLRLLGTQTIQK